MTRMEFTAGVAFVERAVGVAMGRDRVDAFFELLGDLECEIFLIACRRVVLEHRWNTFPSIAEIRQAASETRRGQLAELSAAEAWRLAWSATGRIDPEILGSAERACARLPAIVVEAMTSFGINALCYGKEPVGVVRGQFLKIFESLAAREKRLALIPPHVAAAVTSIGRLPSDVRGVGDVRGVVARIGAVS